MISPDHVRLMARYNAWQNASLFTAVATIDDAARRIDRGAFFGSIHATLNHILWADRIWMARFAEGFEAPPPGFDASTQLHRDWADLAAARRDFDQRIADWAANVSPDWLSGELSWFSGAAGREISQPRWRLVAHIFNHQTHHRGQVHAMATAAGARPEDTDLFLMPET